MRTPLAALLLAGALALSAAPGLAATPPDQPKTGPGGADYAASEVVKRAVGRASGAATFAFHAAGEATKPRPVVVMLHAWGATNPQAYGAWIEHLARRGNLVLWPRFQEPNRTRPAEATDNAATLLKEALAALAEDPAAKPDLGRVAYVGHLAGSPLAFNLAAVAKERGLPVPKLVYGLMSGGIASDAKSRGILLADLSQIDPATLIVTMIGDREHLASDRASKRLLKEAAGVPATRKVFMRALSDGHGFPVLSATLTSPGATDEDYDAAKIKLPPDPPRDPKQPQPRAPKWSADMVLTGEQTVLVQQLGNNVTDTLDYLAFWRTLDMAAAAAFAGKDGEALRADGAFVDMGRWSDGWPLKRLVAEAPKVEEVKPGASTAAATAEADRAAAPGSAPTRRR